MDCQQSLVGGDDMLAVFDRLEHKTPGRLIAANQFDDHGNIRIGQHLVGIAVAVFGWDRQLHVLGIGGAAFGILQLVAAWLQS